MEDAVKTVSDLSRYLHHPEWFSTEIQRNPLRDVSIPSSFFCPHVSFQFSISNEMLKQN